MQPRTLSPHSLEAEMALIGSVLIDARDLPSLSAIVMPADFYEVRHRWIWESVLLLAERHADIDNVSVADDLRARGKLDECGGPAYITELINSAPSFLHAETYARVVKDAASRRAIIQAAGQIAEAALNGDYTVDEVAATAETLLARVTRHTRPAAIRIGDAAMSYYRQLEARHERGGDVPGLRTGYAGLDRLLNGFKPGRLYLLAARPGVGKTAFMLNLAVNVALAHADVLVKVASLEMSQDQLLNRIYASMTGINAQLLERGELTPESWERVTRAVGRLSRLNIELDDVPLLTPSRLRASCGRAAQYGALGIVFVDYLQLMRPDRQGDSLYRDVTGISQSLKALARDLNVPVVALAQLNRAVEARSNKRPRLSDLRDSGSLEQDADVVMFLYRDQDGAPRDGVELIVAKQRDGETGTVPLRFMRHIQTFEQDQEI
jgi:replicative DNA helicase